MKEGCERLFRRYNSDLPHPKEIGDVIMMVKVDNMGKRYFKGFLAFGIMLFGAIVCIWISEAQKKVLSASDAAEVLTYHLQSLDDYYPEIAIYDDNADIIREWPSEDGTKILHIAGEHLSNDDQYFLFGYYSRANEEDGLKFFSLINFYAVNRETGEILERQAWNDSNVGLNDFNEMCGMSEEEAAKVFFDYKFPQDSFETKGNCYINKVGHVAYEWWDQDYTFYYFWCDGLAENKSYYIFEYWCDMYETGLEDGVETHSFIRAYYWGSYAVNKYNGEIVAKRYEDPETYLFEYSEEYYRIVDPSRE